jgi:antitoxin ParD1/3/4
LPTRNVNLTAEQDAFIEEAVKGGKYQNASEAMRDAVRGLQRRWRLDDVRLEALRGQLQAGADALNRGAFTDIAEADLDAFLDELSAPPAP